MQKTMKTLTPLSLLLRFLAFAAVGLWVIVSPATLADLMNLVCVTVLVINGLPAVLISVYQRKEPHQHAFVNGIVSLLAAGAVLLFPHLLSRSITIIVGLWSLLVGLIQLGYIVQLVATHERGKLRYIVLSIFSLCSSAVLLLSPQGTLFLRVYAGCYLMLYGLWQLIDLFGLLINRNVDNSRFLSHIRIKLPVLLTAMLPPVWLKELEKKQETIRQDTVIHKENSKPQPVDDQLDIIFHLGKNVAFGFGHVDISLRGQTISYGCYDEGSNRLFGLLSDGVFMTAPTAPYLDYCRAIEGKLLVGFTLALTHQEGERVAAAIRYIISACEPWQPADRPEYSFGARFFKVKQGCFALYNALRTNCAAMAEIIASESGLALLPPNGFVTPGSYFSFLKSELRDPGSKVIKQTIYAKATETR